LKYDTEKTMLASVPGTVIDTQFDGDISSCSKPSDAEAAKRQKIQRIFDGAAKAKLRRGNPQATGDFIKLRAEADRLPKTGKAE
jgi:hypothetical protein